MTANSQLFKLVAVSAALIPIHFLVQDRSHVHVLLNLVAATVFLVTFVGGWFAARKGLRLDEKRSRFFEPSLLAFAVWIVHGVCTPLVSFTR